ncbi:MAG TPA: GMC family oxidoreductase [Mycobacteriales bacterium]|nr:GMC family oxidoreductase [Mycobacteriales bacterium]
MAKTMRKAVIAGSGAGASVTALTLAEAGWHVVMLEKGPNYFTGLGKSWPPTTTFSNDNLKLTRNFEQPDPSAYPRTFRSSASQKSDYYVGAVNELPVAVGGGTIHYGAAMPRFWDIDFKQLSMLGPYPGADVADWPFEYSDIAPLYDHLEHQIGVQGDRSAMPHEPVLKHARRDKEYPMPAGPPQRGSMLVANGAKTLGLHPYPFPHAINSKPYNGRPVCNNCGFCDAYGCPTSARGSALDLLHRALLTGRVELRPETMVHKVEMKGRRATGLQWIDQHGRRGVERGDIVVLAASGIESARIALMSKLPDPHHRIGKRLMFHYFTSGFGVFLDQRLHAYKSWGAETHCMEDFSDPDFTGARVFAKAQGLPYIRGGLCELGGSEEVIAEAQFYQYILGAVSPEQPFGRTFKELMRTSLLRDRLAGIQMLGHDLPYLSNNVTLDPRVRDRHGFPVPRITYAPGKHEHVAQEFYIPLITSVLLAAGATVAAAVPANTPLMGPNGVLPLTRHVLGGMQMGTDPKSSVVDEWGRVHATDNVYVHDGGVFATAGANNPTLTIMAVVLRMARHLAAG